MADVTLTQTGRWLSLRTPLGPDALVPTEVTGEEGLSELFRFEITALSETASIPPQDLLGKAVTLGMARPGGAQRLTNGIVTAIAGGRLTRSGFRVYRITVAPSLWLLDRTSDYEVYQTKTVPQIAEAILKAAGVTYKLSLQGTYPTRDYCVQYGETDLAFLRRLFAEEGIAFYFAHEEGKHTLVLFDKPAGYADGAQASIAYRQDAEETADAVYALESGAVLTDAKWTLGDYDFETPDTKLEGTSKTNLQPASAKTWEHYLFGVGTPKAAELTRLAGVSVDAMDAAHEVLEGAGTCATFTPGHRFTLSEHPVAALKDKKLVVTRVRHEARDRTHFTIRPGEEGKPFYRNHFACIPSTRPAPRAIPPQKPIARGPQTALVVGPTGQEIHTDKYGRIRVQFPWDRVGKKNETSSCFVRVAQAWAGAGWGSLFIPRIGMEVVVHFLDGDPDRPLVTGAVYNATHMPPWTLPDQATKSGLLTRSTLQGSTATANELSFDDKKDSELVLFHAQKDFTREVENDDKLDVGHDQTRTIKNNRTTTISEGNETFTISKGNRTETISEGNDALTITKGNSTTTLNQGNRSATLAQGNDTLTLTQGNVTVTLDAGNHATACTAGKITLEAGQSITLTCGQSSIELKPDGITINGLQVTAKGTAKLDVQSPMTTLKGDATMQINGGMVKIN